MPLFLRVIVCEVISWFFLRARRTMWHATVCVCIDSDTIFEECAILKWINATFLNQSKQYILFMLFILRIVATLGVSGHCKIAHFIFDHLSGPCHMKWLRNRYVYSTFAHVFQSNFKWDFSNGLPYTAHWVNINPKSKRIESIPFSLARCALSTHRQSSWSKIFSLVHCRNYKEAVDFN